MRWGAADAPRAVVLLHGFGANLRHWRHNSSVLAEVAEVFALDLLGFGASDKPPSRLQGERSRPGAIRYGFALWSELVADFVASQVVGPASGRPVHLVGNSIGGVVALAAAQRLRDGGTPPAQVILIDCAQRTLDERRVGELPFFERLSRPLLKRMVRERWLTATLFRFLARPAFIRQVLAVAYPTGANVDAELVALLHAPSREPGAQESFRGFVNLFADVLAPDFLAELDLPVRMLWGGADPWESHEEAERWARDFPSIRELKVLEGLGHCPHDEAPEQVNPILLRWLTLDQ
ncbi:MAG: alpha/beta fold hydrolase [Cyanobacteria bacterium K_Offshore_surface_m2_239]|nr:alpha/beta fold hydrolase [Cyanobacteria bacterium K_Offshore_surface_m2_239]